MLSIDLVHLCMNNQQTASPYAKSPCSLHVQDMFACQHLIAAVWLNKFICMIQLSVCLRGLMTSRYDAMNGNWITFSGFSVGCCLNREKGYLLPTWVRKISLPTFQLNDPVIVITLGNWILWECLLTPVYTCTWINELIAIYMYDTTVYVYRWCLLRRRMIFLSWQFWEFFRRW